MPGLWCLDNALNVGGGNGYPRLTNGVAAFFLLAVAWLAHPRFPQLPGTPVTPEQAPEFHALIRDVAAQLQVSPAAQVTLQTDVNAFMGHSGFPPRPAPHHAARWAWACRCGTACRPRPAWLSWRTNWRTGATATRPGRT